jgi:hypothetical protein
LRRGFANANSYSYCYRNRDCHSYADLYTYTAAYTYTQAFPNAAATSDAGTAPVTRNITFEISTGPQRTPVRSQGSCNWRRFALGPRSWKVIAVRARTGSPTSRRHVRCRDNDAATPLNPFDASLFGDDNARP